jgi:stress response protein YsnF
VADDPATETVTLAEETARVETRQVETGRVRVETRTEVGEEIVRATLAGDVVDVVRVPIDRVVTEAPAVRVEGDETVVPILEEILVVEKRLLLKEEVRIRRRTETTEIEVPVQVRRQRAVVERTAADGEPEDAEQ